MPRDPDRGPRLVSGLLPHTGAARLLTDVVSHEPGSIEAVGEIPASYPLVSSSGAPCFLGLELAAQAAAALEALTRVARGGEPGGLVGYLVRVREAEFLRPELPTDTPLRVTARLEEAAPPLAILRVGISVGGVEHLRAVLGTYGGVR